MEIKKSGRTQEVHSNEDNSITVVVQSLKEDKYWREYWSIFRNGLEGLQKDEVTC